MLGKVNRDFLENVAAKIRGFRYRTPLSMEILYERLIIMLSFQVGKIKRCSKGRWNILESYYENFSRGYEYYNTFASEVSSFIN